MSESSKVDLDSLFDEQNLAAIFRQAPSDFSDGFNLWALCITVGVLSVFAIAHVFVTSIRDGFVFPFADTFAIWANLGASLAGTILGFLIAGFSIVCTILRPQTMIALQRLRNEKYDQTELKLLFVLFINVLVQYLALLLFSVVVTIVGGKFGPAAILGRYLGKVHWLIPFVLLHVIFVAWGSWLVMLVLTLKSFVYNLYQSLLLGLADAVDDYQRERFVIKCERADVHVPGEQR